MKDFRKILLILTFIFIFSACGNEKQEGVKEPIRTADSLDNMLRKGNLNKTEQKTSNKQVSEDKDPRKDETSEETISREDRIETITLKAVGDIMANMGQIEYAYNKGNGSYDFKDSFKYISDFISDADIAIANYETTTDPNKAYAGHPRFNAPPEYLKAIADAGFDIVTTANNHSLDSEIEGIGTTIDAIEEAGLDHVGTRKSGNERYIIKKVGDINIAFLSYTYGCNGIEDLFVVRDEVDQVNYIHEDLIKKDIRDAKEHGADFVVVYPHWGIELRSDADQSQIDLGHKMIDWGADLVIGNHPHVVEPYELYESENGNKGFIAYACGNFISIQNLETVNDIRTEQSVAYEFKLSKNLSDGFTSIDQIDEYPLWVGMTYNEYGRSVSTYRCEDFLEGGKYYDKVDENQRNRIQQAYDDTNKTLHSMEGE